MNQQKFIEGLCAEKYNPAKHLRDSEFLEKSPEVNTVKGDRPDELVDDEIEQIMLDNDDHDCGGHEEGCQACVKLNQ